MEVHFNNLTWAKQIESGKQYSPSQTNTLLKYIKNSMNVFQDSNINNMLLSSNLKPLAILYSEN